MVFTSDARAMFSRIFINVIFYSCEISGHTSLLPIHNNPTSAPLYPQRKPPTFQEARFSSQIAPLLRSYEYVYVSSLSNVHISLLSFGQKGAMERIETVKKDAETTCAMALALMRQSPELCEMASIWFTCRPRMLPWLPRPVVRRVEVDGLEEGREKTKLEKDGNSVWVVERAE